MHFGNRLKKLREENELTQAKLAEELSVRESDIFFIENNLKHPTYSLLRAAADYFSVDADYLLGQDNIDLKILGSRIKEHRKKLGLLQPELGGAINVAKSNISYYEIGKSRPNVETLYKIANVLGVSIDYLLGRTNIKKSHCIDTSQLSEDTKEYLEFKIKLDKLGVTPKRALEIIEGLSNMGLIDSANNK
ncbi:helix-turn-helix domain-containing protein [Wukongibacter baidiensis]